MSPIGSSDHVCILWNPKILKKRQNTLEVKRIRPLLNSGIRAFGRWIQSQNWNEILKCANTQGKVDIFYNLLDSAMDSCFPFKSYMNHVNDKPWLTPHLKKLLIVKWLLTLITWFFGANIEI